MRVLRSYAIREAVAMHVGRSRAAGVVISPIVSCETDGAKLVIKPARRREGGLRARHERREPRALARGRRPAAVARSGVALLAADAAAAGLRAGATKRANQRGRRREA